MIWKLPQAAILIALGVTGAILAILADLLFVIITVIPMFIPFIIMVDEHFPPWAVADPLLDASVKLMRKGMKEVTG